MTEEIFVMSPGHRITRKFKRLKKSLLKWGWIPSKPLDAIRRSDGKLEVRDGHHRLLIAQELGITVNYVVQGESG